MSESDESRAEPLPHTNVSHILNQAHELARAGRWGAVSEELRHGLLLNASGPDKGHMHALRARSEYRQGLLEIAKYHAEMALDLIPLDLRAHDAEAALAEAVLWEIEWSRKYPNPNAAQLAWHMLLRWLHGDKVYRVR